MSVDHTSGLECIDVGNLKPFSQAIFQSKFQGKIELSWIELGSRVQKDTDSKMGRVIKKTEAESKILRNVKEEIYVADDILKRHEAGNTGRGIWSLTSLCWHQIQNFVTG